LYAFRIARATPACTSICSFVTSCTGAVDENRALTSTTAAHIVTYGKSDAAASKELHAITYEDTSRSAALAEGMGL